MYSRHMYISLYTIVSEHVHSIRDFVSEFSSRKITINHLTVLNLSIIFWKKLIGDIIEDSWPKTTTVLQPGHVDILPNGQMMCISTYVECSRFCAKWLSWICKECKVRVYTIYDDHILLERYKNKKTREWVTFRK